MNEAVQQVDDVRTLSVRDVADRFRVSLSTIWRWKDRPDFPQPMTLGERATRWLESEINEYIARAKLERDNKLSLDKVNLEKQNE